jgi:hypothetical protein
MTPEQACTELHKRLTMYGYPNWLTSIGLGLDAEPPREPAIFVYLKRKKEGTAAIRRVLVDAGQVTDSFHGTKVIVKYTGPIKPARRKL